MRRSLMILALAAPAAVVSAQPMPAWRTAPLTAGSWSYRETATGSEAIFTDARVTRRLLVKCSRLTRRVSLSVASASPGSAIQIATSETDRTLPATFDTQGFQIIAELGAMDPVLDAIVFSRGRFAITVAGGAALVVPAWPEIARSIEDCRV
jgi:hypothetical protein